MILLSCLFSYFLCACDIFVSTPSSKKRGWDLFWKINLDLLLGNGAFHFKGGGVLYIDLHQFNKMSSEEEKKSRNKERKIGGWCSNGQNWQ